jgi:putative SOS response-associated peptidase YedK
MIGFTCPYSRHAVRTSGLPTLRSERLTGLRQPDNTMLETCAILTTPPNVLVAEVHDRMPAILSEEDYDRWLDPGITDPDRVADCLKPFDSQLMKKYPVSSRLNRPENDDQECAQEVPAENAFFAFV